MNLTREQLEDRLAALHQASLELVRDLSRNAVLERIVNLAREQANARYAALGMVDEDGNLERFITVGMTDEEIARMEHPPRGLGLIGALQQERHTIRVADIQQDPRHVGFPPGHPPMRSFLGVPILSGDRLLGQIYLTEKEDAPEFTEADERVIETLAAYAAVAIENARLYNGVKHVSAMLEERNEDLSLLDNLAKTLASSLEIDEILDQALSRVIDYLGVDAGEIFLREPGTTILRLALHRGESADAFWARERFEVGECVVGQVAERGEIVVITDLASETHFLRPAVVEAGFTSLACIPLTARREVVGAMTVVSRAPRAFSERELTLMESIGAWAGMAVENARLHRQGRRLAVLEERERIGMDLHDGIIQSIYGVGLTLEYARLEIDENPDAAREKVSQSIDGLNAAIRDLRAYILDLNPRQLHSDETLVQGLQRLLAEFQANTLTEAPLLTSSDHLEKLPRENALALFHICQEALANVAKHARASKTEVHLWTTDDRALLEIRDDGNGFDMHAKHAALGHGLSNMARRARKVGGEVEITSVQGEGTTVLAWVPKR